MARVAMLTMLVHRAGRVSALLAACLFLGAGSAAGAGDPLTIDTDRGPVHGARVGGVRQFLGIPYAAPPVGSLRWRPPEPPAPWTAPLGATNGGARCPQVLPGLNGRLGDESCLFV